MPDGTRAARAGIADRPPAASTVWRPSFRPDPAFATLGVKTVTRRRDVWWWASVTPDGPATLAFRLVGDAVRADAWGPGGPWLVDGLPCLLGADDAGVDEFEPLRRRLACLPGPVGQAARRRRVWRIGATVRWYEAAATAVVGQRVVTADAAAARTRLARRHGPPVPGPCPGPVWPAPQELLGLDDAAFHRAGIERSRARAMRMVARHADRLEHLAARDPATARSWLTRLPGIGPWTAAATTAVAAGDADAVAFGDLHLPRLVVTALTGDERLAGRSDDATLAEVLQPFAGHRHRVVRLVEQAGTGSPATRPLPRRHDITRL